MKPRLTDLIGKVNFLSPFECYKKVRPYLDHLHQEKLRQHLEAQREKEAAAQKEDSSIDLSHEERIQRVRTIFFIFFYYCPIAVFYYWFLNLDINGREESFIIQYLGYMLEGSRVFSICMI